MNQITDTLRDSKRLRLIATALELLHCERGDSAVILIPGTEPQRYVVVGSAETVARLLEIALAAPVAKAVPEGWKMVPIEPTLEMQQAGFDTPGAHMYAASYRAMIAAAPDAPTAQEVTQQAANAETAEQANVLRDDLQQTVSDFRKATYEFARGQDPVDHAAMMAAQKRIFDIADQLAPTTSTVSTVSAPEEAILSDALTTIRWMYRRLPQTYGCVPGVEQSIKSLAKQLGEDVTDDLRERAVRVGVHVEGAAREALKRTDTGSAA